MDPKDHVFFVMGRLQGISMEHVFQSCCKRWIQYSTLDIQMKSVDLLLLLNSKLLILQPQLIIQNIRVGEACYHTEEIGVDCDKTTHGHSCCVIR